jgi:dehydrogenase/reductase SDR family protein 12
VAYELAKHNVNVLVTGRDEVKGKETCKEHSYLSFTQMDMANWNDIGKIVDNSNELDYVILNAGGMPISFLKNAHDVEMQFSSQLFGHYFLIKKLKESGKLKMGAKIVWVTSGGMYFSNLDLNKIFEDDNYNKVKTYANVKRAQVTLLPFLKKEFNKQVITCMHPGWVETPGVSSSIPEFDKKMKGKLRTPLQGADTILWLLGSKEDNIVSGELYFDRRIVKKHFFWFSKASDKKLPSLVSILKKFYIK